MSGTRCAFFIGLISLLCTTTLYAQTTSRGLRNETTTAPAVAPQSCPASEKQFPFLKPWVEKLGGFVAPYDVGSNDGSLFFAIGITYVKKNTVEKWKTDTVTLPLEWKAQRGSLETAWLGPLVPFTPTVKAGPGAASVASSGKGVPYKSGVQVRAGGNDLPAYGREAILETAKKTPGYWARFWSQLFAPTEIELLTKCESSDCKIKFNESELKTVLGASHQYRLNKLREVLINRVDAYRQKGHLFSYEGSSQPTDWEDLPIDPKFPKTIATHFWLPGERSNYGYERFDPEPGHHKPVTAFYSRQCEKRGEGERAYTACTDLVLYNNHYFDFWGRVVLFFPWCDGEVALAYEAVDIDQIKESRVARLLFGSEMRRLFGLLLETRLRRLHMLGS